MKQGMLAPSEPALGQHRRDGVGDGSGLNLATEKASRWRRHRDASARRGRSNAMPKKVPPRYRLADSRRILDSVGQLRRA